MGHHWAGGVHVPCMLFAVVEVSMEFIHVVPPDWETLFTWFSFFILRRIGCWTVHSSVQCVTGWCVDVGHQEESGWFKLPVNNSFQLSTRFYKNSVVYSPVDSTIRLSTGFCRKFGNYKHVDSTLHLSTDLLRIRIPNLFRSYFLGPFWIPIYFISVSLF